MEREKCLKLVNRYITSLALRKHAIAVEAVMSELADYFKEDKQMYQTVGLLHDLDWESTSENPARHGLETVEILKKEGIGNQKVREAILTHNYLHNDFRPPKSKLEWSLYCCDELTGFITAVALVTPKQSLEEVNAGMILRKFPQRAFAAKVNRQQIAQCEEKLKIPLEKFVGLALKAMRSVRQSLGL